MRKFPHLYAVIALMGMLLCVFVQVTYTNYSTPFLFRGGIVVTFIAVSVVGFRAITMFRTDGGNAEVRAIEAFFTFCQPDIDHAKRRSFVADLLLPIKLSSDLHANLDEVEPLWMTAHGIRRARWIRRSQEFQAIAKYWASPVRQAFQAVLKVIR